MPQSLLWSAKQGRRSENEKPKEGESVPQGNLLEGKINLTIENTSALTGKTPFPPAHCMSPWSAAAALHSTTTITSYLGCLGHETIW